MNIIKIIDCIDMEKSKYKMYKACNDIQYIDKYELIISKLENTTLFKIDKYITGNIFATDTFKDVIELNGITGLKFTKVWGSE